MRIHYVTLRIDLRSGGGSHRHTVNLIRLLREMGYEVEVHCLFSTRNFPPSDITPYIYHAENLSYRTFQKFVANLLKKNEADSTLFFCSGPALAFGAGKYRKEGGKVPTAVYLDNYLSSMGNITGTTTESSTRSLSGQVKQFLYHIKRVIYDRIIGRYYAAAVDRFFVASPYQEDVFVQFGFPKQRFIVAPHFFDDPPPSPPRSYTKADPVSLLYVGRFTRDKGVDVLLRALKGIDPKKWVLHLVGDGVQKDELVSLAKELGISDSVVFVGWVGPEALEAEYRNADVFVHPCRWAEPLGRTIIEAMQRGLPLIVPKYGGSAWAAEGAALTFVNGDASSLQHALTSMLENRAQRETFGKAGVVRAHAFSRDVLAPRFKDAIREMLP